AGISMDWRTARHWLGAAEGRSLHGDLFALLQWAQLYAQPATQPERALVATSHRGAWCASELESGCVFSARLDHSDEPVEGPALLAVSIEKSGPQPAQLLFAGKGCSTRDGGWHVRPF